MSLVDNIFKKMIQQIDLVDISYMLVLVDDKGRDVHEHWHYHGLLIKY